MDAIDITEKYGELIEREKKWLIKQRRGVLWLILVCIWNEGPLINNGGRDGWDRSWMKLLFGAIMPRVKITYKPERERERERERESGWGEEGRKEGRLFSFLHSEYMAKLSVSLYFSWQWQEFESR